ncbi:MAG: ECF transporter S component [Spirochaetales bacterium]|nr:ECF transporter S component [Spirochaetales bacterium]
MSETNRTRQIVITAVMAAISVVLGATRLGFIPWFSGASLTIMHVPVIIGAILEGPIVGVIVGLIFGLFSLIQAAVSPTGAVDVFFVNPLISVLPRIMIGLVAWTVFRAFNGKMTVLSTILASIAGSLTNTILVLGALGIAGALPWEIIWAIITANGLAEAGVAAVICTAIILAWKSIANPDLVAGKKSSLDDLDDQEEEK